MATKIINGYDLAGGTLQSSAITEVGDLVLHAKVSGVSTATEVKFSVMAKEGDADYSPVLDNDKNQINFYTKGNMSSRLKLAGIDAENIKIYVTSNVYVGTVTVEYTKTAKATS